MKNLSKLLMTFTSVLVVSACSCKKEQVSEETAEESRKQARSNATFNVKEYLKTNVLLQDKMLETFTDSSIKRDCPQGDGWATMHFTDKVTGVKTYVKCSTVSMGIGCLEESVFKSKDYASEDGRCNPNITYPLPKIGNQP